MTKQLVKKYLYDLDIYNTFDGLTIEEVVNNLLTIKKEYPNSKLFVDVSYFGYNDEKEIKLFEERMETDGEYEIRLACEQKEKEAEKKAAVKKEEQDRLEYERLKKKFEGTT